MRLAILPICSFRNLLGESEVVMFANQIRDWCTNHEDVFVYMILPKDCETQGWILDREEVPRQKAVWADELDLYYEHLAKVPATFAQMFGMRNGQYQIDALITSRRPLAALYGRQLWDPRLKETLPVFIDESMTAEWGKTPSTVSEIELVAQTLGYACGWPVWDTESQRKNALSAARHYLAGAQVLKAMERGVVIPCGFDPGRTSKILADHGQLPVDQRGVGTIARMIEQGAESAAGFWEHQKNERFTCFFGGRLNRGSKRADILLREYDTFFKFGRDIDITVCSPKDEGWILDEIREQYPEINVLVQTPSDEFKVRASKAHVFLNTSASEGFSVGFAEMMFLTKYGTVLIAPRLDWVQGMFEDKFDDYPLLYEDFEQARVMLRWVHENYDEAVEQTSWLGDWVAERFDMARTNEEHFQHYRSVIDQVLTPEFSRNLMGPANVELTLEAFEAMPPKFGLDQLYREMIERSRAMKEDPRRGQTTRWAVRRWLMDQGMALDTHLTAEPELIKVG